VTNLKVDSQESLGILINLSIGIIGNNWRVEEIEEAVSFNLLGDCSDAAFGLMLLLLLDLFDCQILPFLPINCTSGAFDDFRSLEERTSVNLFGEVK